jgi:hypothetical protein
MKRTRCSTELGTMCSVRYIFVAHHVPGQSWRKASRSERSGVRKKGLEAEWDLEGWTRIFVIHLLF